MSFIDAIFGGGANSRFQPHHLDKLVQDAARVDCEHPVDSGYVPPRHSSATSKAAKLGTTVVAGIGVAETASRLYDSPFVNKVAHTVTNTIPNVVKEQASNLGQTMSDGAEKVSEAAGSVFGTAGEYFGHAKSLWSWSSWGFSFLPGSVKLVVAGAGIYGAWQLYRYIRNPNSYGGSSTNTLNSNVNLHLNLPHLPATCRPVVKTTTLPDGQKDVHVGIECDDPKSPSETKEAFQQRYIRKAPVRVANKLNTAREYHEQLTQYKGRIHDKSIELSDSLKTAIQTLASEYDELAKVDYVDAGLTTFLGRAGSVLKKTHNELRAREYHSRLTAIVAEKMSLLSDKHLKSDIKDLKIRFDGMANDHYYVRKLDYHLNRAGEALEEADKEITEYTRTVVHRMRPKSK